MYDQGKISAWAYCCLPTISSIPLQDPVKQGNLKASWKLLPLNRWSWRKVRSTQCIYTWQAENTVVKCMIHYHSIGVAPPSTEYAQRRPKRPNIVVSFSYTCKLDKVANMLVMYLSCEIPTVKISHVALNTVPIHSSQKYIHCISWQRNSIKLSV